MFYARHLLDKNETTAESVAGMLEARDLYQEAWHSWKYMSERGR